MYRLFDSTELTLDLATPVEGARASLHDRHLLRLVASTAAHQVAAVHSDAGVVALPAVSAEDTQLGVLLAERWRGLQVDQVLRPGRLVLRVVGFQLEIVSVSTTQPLPMPVHRVARRIANDRVSVPSNSVRVAHHHPRGAVETVLQVVADHAERGQPHPAGLHGAGAGHAVALALLPHFR